ncbi:MAG: phosphotransferase [Patescibacteria group bacterium]
MAGMEPLLTSAAVAYGFNIRHCRPARRTWRLETDRGVFALKAAPPSATASFLRRAETHLVANGFTRLPGIVATRTGEPELILPDGERYILRPWLPGVRPVLDLEHKRDVERVGEALAEMHLASLGFPKAGEPRPDVPSWLSTLEARREDLLLFRDTAADGGGFARLYRRALPAALADCEAAMALLREAGYVELAREREKTGGLCHGDVAANNMLVHGRHAYLLDFDRAAPDVFPYDLAMLLWRALPPQGWRADLASALLDAYRRVRALAPAEQKTIAALLHWPQQFWRLGSQYFRERLDRSERFFRGRLWQWTQGAPARQSFLADARRGL